MDFANVAQNLADYGLETVLWIPGRGEGNEKIQIGGGRPRPLVRVSDVEKFRAEFPNADSIITAALDGQSIRVKLQGRIRAAVEKDRQVSDEALVLGQVQSLASARVGIAPTSMSDDSLLAELAKRKGITVEEARALFE